jgi:hypothetical protein
MSPHCCQVLFLRVNPSLVGLRGDDAVRISDSDYFQGLEDLIDERTHGFRSHVQSAASLDDERGASGSPREEVARLPDKCRQKLRAYSMGRRAGLDTKEVVGDLR